MKKLASLCLCLYLIFIAFQTQVVHGSAGAVGSDPVNPSTLNSLRQGGYILYVRHGEASIGADQPNLIYGDCATQRNLSVEGRRQAMAYRDAFRKLQIPVHFPVTASPLCRTRETAELAFGKPNVQIDPFWIQIYRLGGNVTNVEMTNTLTELTSKLEKVPVPGTNSVIIAHGFPPGVGLGDIPYLGTVVVKPKGQGKGYDIIDRFSLEELAGSR